MPDTHPIRWEPDRSVALPRWPQPPMPTAILRGAINRCPACGVTRLFRGFLRVEPVCANCAAPLGSARADDAPPYFTIVAVGHIIIPLMLMGERSFAPSLWLQAAIWIPLSLLLTVLLLRPIKGGTVGLMLKLGLMKSDDED